MKFLEVDVLAGTIDDEGKLTKAQAEDMVLQLKVKLYAPWSR